MTLDVLEQEGGAAGLSGFRLAYAIGDLRDLQDRIGFGLDTL